MQNANLLPHVCNTAIFFIFEIQNPRVMRLALELTLVSLQVYGTNFSVAVFGDHGMTEGGSHGGSSKLETLVPVVFVDRKNRPAVKEVLPGKFQIEFNTNDLSVFLRFW